MSTANLRHDWSRDEIVALFELPFNDLLHRAHSTHRANHDPNAVQVSTLLSMAEVADAIYRREIRLGSTGTRPLTTSVDPLLRICAKFCATVENTTGIAGSLSRACRTSAATPTIKPRSILTPTGSRSRKYWRARASFTTITTGCPAASSGVKSRPRRIATPIAVKYPGVT